VSSERRFPHLPAESWDLFLEERLPAESTRRLEEHLDACAECRRALEQADPSRLFRRLRGLEVRPEVWDGFWEDLSAQLSADAPEGDDELATDMPAGVSSEATPPPSASRPATAPARRPAPWLAAAAALAVVTLAGVLATWGPTGSEPPVIRADGSCPPSAAGLALSRDECAALFSDRLDRLQPQVVIVRADLDLRGL